MGAEVRLEPGPIPATADQDVLVRIEELPPAACCHGQTKQGVRPQLCPAGQEKIAVRLHPPGKVRHKEAAIGLPLQ